MDLKRHNQEILISSLVSSSAVWNIFPLCHWVTVRKITVNVRSKNTLATSCEELTHWERFWCWKGLGAGGEVDDRGWDGWIVSLTRWTQIWVNSGSWWWTGRPGVLWFMGSQRVGHDWVTELNWTELKNSISSGIKKSRPSKPKEHTTPRKNSKIHLNLGR